MCHKESLPFTKAAGRRPGAEPAMRHCFVVVVVVVVVVIVVTEQYACRVLQINQ